MRSSVIPPTPTLSSIVSSTTLTGSNLPARACAAPRKSKPERLDQPSSTVTKIHRSAKLATRAASFRYGGRHHSGIPGGIIPLYPGGFVGIGRLFPRGEVTALCDLVVVDQVGIGALGPTARSLVQLVLENAYSNWNRDTFDSKERN